MTATNVVDRFLAVHRTLQRSYDHGGTYRVGALDEAFNDQWLTRFAWEQFHEVPSTAAVRNAAAMLRALAVEL